MQHFSAHDAESRFGQLLDAARDGPVAIEQGGRRVAVLMSNATLDALEALNLGRLRTEVDKGITAIARGDFTDVDEGGLAGLADRIKTAGRRRVAE
jgi:prevent-host-death family protein